VTSSQQLPTEGDIAGRYQSSLIDWSTFRDTERTRENWLVEPLLPRGRAIATYSPAKSGKSLLSLDIAARLASGQRALDQSGGPPVSVVYLDLEMTAGDLHERLSDMSYGPEVDLSCSTTICFRNFLR
jgi:RecA-family ATPase